MIAARVQTSWWLDASALPERLLWARLEITPDGSATVLDLDGRYHQFSDERAARYWLLEDEYALLADLIETGEVERGVLPPTARNDEELIPQMCVELATLEPPPEFQGEPLQSTGESGRAEYSGWVREDSLQSFLELISTEHGYSFDADEWGAFTVGLKQTDAERELWFEYTLGPDGTAPTLRVALDVGTEVVRVSVAGTPELCRYAAFAAKVVHGFRLSRRL